MTIQSLTLFIERWGQSLFPFNLGELGECSDLGTDRNWELLSAGTVSGPRFKSRRQCAKRCFHCLPLGTLLSGAPAAMCSLTA